MRFSKLLFLLLLLILMSISVSAQDNLLGYEQVAEHEVGEVRDLMMLNDGTYVVASDSGLWASNPSGLELRQQETPAAVSHMYYYNGFQILLVYEDNSMGIWDVISAMELSHYSGHSGAIRDVLVFTLPDGGVFLVSGSDDGTVRLWDVVTASEEALIFESESPIKELAYHPLMGIVASVTEDNRVHLWLFPQRQELGILEFDEPVSAIGFSPFTDTQNMLVGMADGSIHVWDIVTQASFEYEGVVYPLYEVPLESGTQNLGLVSPGRRESNFIDPNNPSAGLITWTGNWRTLEAVVPSIEESTETRVLDAHNAPVQMILSNFRHSFAIDESNTISAWVGDYAELYHLELDANAEIIFINDASNHIFATVHEDNSVLIWNTESGTEYAQLPAQTGKTTHLATSVSMPYTMASVTEDGILHIWAIVE